MNTDAAEFEIEAIALCDQVRHEISGKLILIGLYNDIIMVQNLPTPLQFTVVPLVRAHKAGPFEVSVELRDQHGNSMLPQKISATGGYTGEEGRAQWMPLPLPPFQMNLEGKYDVWVEFLGSAKRAFTFELRRAQPVVQMKKEPGAVH
jgi:hypothetical protein